ncbi:MAG TPA: sulfotransferase [Acetobacteraceae bacterium]|nr:sulfotransferase [Acetobacteraceae bacterium]
MVTPRATDAEAHHRRGIALEQSGRLAEARAAFESALALLPHRALFHHSLARVHRFIPGDPRLPPMQALAQRMAALAAEDQVYLCFALGKAYADLGELDRAFRYYLHGNAVRRRSVTYDEAAALGFLQRIQRCITPQVVAARQGRGADSPLPIFILGMPRSGSTLVEQILASHPQVFGGGELRHFGEALVSAGIGQRYPDGVASLPEDSLRQASERYVAALRATAGPAAIRITDKMPTNYLFLGLIRLALPNAAIVHTRRDPVDCCLSNFTTLFAPGRLAYTYDLGELGRYYRGYDALMRHWRGVLPGAILDVHYEDLVTGFESAARRIVAHCGLDWHDACLRFYAARRQVQTASVSEVRQPVHAGAIGRWQAQKHLYEPLLKAMGMPA